MAAVLSRRPPAAKCQSLAARLSHVWPYISVANKDRVLKFKICSKQTKNASKKKIVCSRLSRLVSLQKMKFRCADTLAETP